MRRRSQQQGADETTVTLALHPEQLCPGCSFRNSGAVFGAAPVIPRLPTQLRLMCAQAQGPLESTPASWPLPSLLVAPLLVVCLWLLHHVQRGRAGETVPCRVENPHRDLWQSEALGIVASLYTVWQLASCETALLDPKALQPSRERLLEADDAHPHSATMWFRLTKQVPSSVNIFY